MTSKNSNYSATKTKQNKCVGGICVTHTAPQTACASYVNSLPAVRSFEASVDIIVDGKTYRSDFAAIGVSGERIIFECVTEHMLSRTDVLNMLDKSRNYWLAHNVSDWRLLVVRKELSR